MNAFTTLIEAFEANCIEASNLPNRTITYIEGKDKETVVSYVDLKQRALGYSMNSKYEV